jgi:RNA polymerase sigma-70 factor, ECF subfamily
MNRTDRNFSQSSEAERPAVPDYLLPDDDDEPASERSAPPIRDSFEDLGSQLARHTSRSRPDASRAFHGRMSEAMSAALFEQIAVERSEIAFKEFYDFLAPKVYSVIYRIVQSEDDALDLLQEVFTHFWDSAPELYKVHSNISAWILLLARNRAVDETRSTRFQKQRQMESYDVQDHEYLVTDTHTTDEKLTADAGRLEIQKAFEVLSEDHRKIMELVFFAGMTMKAVADMMQLSPGTVRNAVQSSIKKLRGMLDPEATIDLQFEKPSKKTEKTSKMATSPKSAKAKPIKANVEPIEVVKPIEAVKPIEPVISESIKIPKIKKEPKLKKVTEASEEIKTQEELKKAPKEKVIRPKAADGIAKRAVGRPSRSSKFHSLLDDLMKNRQDVLDISTPAENPANTTLENL